MAHMIQCRGISKKAGATKALKNVSFTALPGEIIAILGMNGSGKTTLLKTLSTLFSPDSGSITLFDGPGPGKNNRELRRHIGFLFDCPAHWEHLSGWDNAYFFATSYGVRSGIAEERLMDLFSRFGLAERRSDTVSTYSYGMKRKLSIIEALAHHPDLIFLDEPSMGLDYSSRMALQEYLNYRLTCGATVIFATNDVYEAQSLADRVILLSRGEVVASGEPLTLLRQLELKTAIELRLGLPPDVSLLGQVPGVEQVRVLEDTPGRYRVRVLASGDHCEAGCGPLLASLTTTVINSGGTLLGIDIFEPNLGDLLRVTGVPPE
jgi:ABC-2 type transport system ATP-binding protein